MKGTLETRDRYLINRISRTWRGASKTSQAFSYEMNLFWDLTAWGL